MMSDEQLSSLGVETIGDRLRLKAFCSSLPSSSTKAAGLSPDLEQEKIDKVKSILNENKRGKRASTKESRGGPSKVRQNLKRSSLSLVGDIGGMGSNNRNEVIVVVKNTG